jgi:DNA replication protein DnaC
MGCRRRTYLAIAVSIRACLAGQRVQFATATEWVARLADAKRQGGLDPELPRLGFVPLLVVDEVGYIPFDPEAANLMFSLVSARYERASLIVTSDKPFSAWGEIFGDDWGIHLSQVEACADGSGGRCGVPAVVRRVPVVVPGR